MVDFVSYFFKLSLLCLDFNVTDIVFGVIIVFVIVCQLTLSLIIVAIIDVVVALSL